MATPRVLVVDDNAINVELVRYILEQEGFAVDAAGDAHEALRRIDRKRGT